MKKGKIYTILLTLILANFVISCKTSHDNIVRTKNWKNASYINESDLLEIDSEKVTFSSHETDNISQINKLIESRTPTRAELSCDPTHVNCSQIRKILISFSIPIKIERKISSDHSQDISLIYEKISEIDCYNQFSNRHNLSKTNPPLGCAVTSNILKMVDNKEQFITPKLLSLPDASTAIKAVRDHK